MLDKAKEVRLWSPTYTERLLRGVTELTPDSNANGEQIDAITPDDVPVGTQFGTVKHEVALTHRRLVPLEIDWRDLLQRHEVINVSVVFSSGRRERYVDAFVDAVSTTKTAEGELADSVTIRPTRIELEA